MAQTGAPQVVVIAGPNGAGKSSAAPELLRDATGIEIFVNADVIAEGLAAYNPGSAAIEAGRVMLRRLSELAAERQSFAFESTLSGRTTFALLRRLIAEGYDVHILYLWLPSVRLAVSRVHKRVELGGHDVPDSDIVRRFSKSVINFDTMYRHLATTWRLYDNSLVGERLLIATGGKGSDTAVLDQDRWAQYQKQRVD